MKKVAVVGTGGIAPVHAGSLRLLGERVELAAAVDIDEDRLAGFCQHFDIAARYTDYATMLDDVKPDAVVLATPPGTHKSMIITAMEAGIDVLCEKPMVASLADLDAIAEAEARTGRHTACVFQQRYGEGAKHLKNLTESGALGKHLVGMCQTTWYRPQAYYDVPWRGTWKDDFGGTSVVHAVHTMDMMLWILGGQWREVYAMMGQLDRKLEAEDALIAVVRMANDALITITNSAVSPRQVTYVRFDYQKATVEAEYLYSNSNADWRYSLPEGSPDEAQLESWAAIPEPALGGLHMEQVSAFIASLENGQVPAVATADVRVPLEFITALYKSALTGQPVAQGSITPDDPFYHAPNGQP